MTSQGMFITFEGGEGTGKTTQIQLLAASLTKILGPNSLVITREPGGAPAAEPIRDLLVNGETERWKPLTEALLLSAARYEHIEQIIKPALMQKKVVISDRFSDSTIIYQGVVGGVSEHNIDSINKIVCGDISPDLTIILDIESKIGLKRAASRGAGENRFEAKGISFHEKVRAGFIDLAAAQSQRCVIIDASQAVQDVANDVLHIVLARFNSAGLIVHSEINSDR